MAEDILQSYSKADGHRELLPVKKVGKSVGVPTTAVTLKKLRSTAGYTKTEGTIDPSVVYILAEGTTRERKYFYYWKNRKGVPIEEKINIELVYYSTKEMAPKLMKKTMDLALINGELQDEDGKIYSIIDLDKIYLLCDVDHYEGDLRVALKDYPRDRYEWIISNPAFEIWLYYCRKNQPYVDLVELVELEASKRSKRLKNILPKFCLGGVDPRKAHENSSVAVSYMDKHYEEDEYGIPKLFSTQMFRIVKYLDELALETHSGKKMKEYSRRVSILKRISRNIQNCTRYRFSPKRSLYLPKAFTFKHHFKRLRKGK